MVWAPGPPLANHQVPWAPLQPGPGTPLVGGVVPPIHLIWGLGTLLVIAGMLSGLLSFSSGIWGWEGKN